MRADVCVYFSVLNLFSYQTLSKCIHRLSVIVWGGGVGWWYMGIFTINIASRSIRKWPWRHIASLQLSVCLSFRPTLSLFIYVDVYVRVWVCFVDITVGFFHYFNIAIFAIAVEFVVFRFLAFVFVLFVVFFGLSVLLFRCLRSNSQRTYVTYHWKDWWM